MQNHDVERQTQKSEVETTGYLDLLTFCARHFSRGVLADLEIKGKPKLDADEQGSMAENAERLAEDLERLGPSFIKGAQLLSSRADFLPPEYQQALSRLQDNVAPVSFESIERIVEEDLGAPIKKLFASFSRESLASASLSQIHTAVLHSGQSVAVKVQRPGVREQVESDYKLVRPLVSMFASKQGEEEHTHLLELFDDTYELLLQELDFSREQENMRSISLRIAKSDNIVTPLPVADYCSGRVLTMSLLHGRKITEIGPLRIQEIDGRQLLEELYSCYLYQILEDGLFHADPHPGNLLLTADGRLGLIDMGMVCRVAPGKRRELINLFLALAEADVERAQESAKRLCREQEGVRHTEFELALEKLILANQGRAVSDINFGETMLRIGEIARENGFVPPRELNFIGKVTVNLERIASLLDKEFDPASATKRHVGRILQGQLIKALRPEHFLQQIVELKELATKLPQRLNLMLDSLSKGIPRLEVDAIDEHFLMFGIQKVANRITLGLIVAALIIAAAQLASVESPHQLFGYPVLSVLLFSIAALLGLVMLVSVFKKDVSRPRSKREN